MTCVNRIVSVAFALLAVVPPRVSAQTDSVAFADVRGLLERGDTVVITDSGGRKTKGALDEITDQAIAVVLHDNLGAERRVFAAPTVAAINRTDSLWNGLLIGAAAGFAATEIFVRRECGPRGSDDECSAIASLVGWLTMVPGGAAAGALIDRAIGNQVVYRAPGGRTALSIAPMVGRRGGGVSVSLRF